MLISREELRFDFQGAKFDLGTAEDRQLLGWIFNQFLYGEVTGIQCGHWLYRAPHLNAATFLAKQASEELSHVRRILRILSLLGESPAPAHWAIRFLSTGMMGGSWGEHVTLEMALGEGLVLTVFYAMADTIPHPEIRKILESATVEEERHVEFGERETAVWLEQNPKSRTYLLSLACLQLWVLERMKGFIVRSILASRPGAVTHPVLSRFEKFYEHTVRSFDLRAQRLGLSDRPLSGMNGVSRFFSIASIPLGKLQLKLGARDRRLTSTYLEDPWVRSEAARQADEARESEGAG